MPVRDLVMIGASAGGVEALRSLVATLPADLPACVLVVLHIPPRASTALPAILGRCAALPTSHAVHGEPITAGRLLIAPPDHHLLVSDGHVVLSPGPQENGHRPAVDPLFRSAALAYGSRVIAVVLSGTRDDGTAGADAVVRHGGVALAQDPDEAMYEAMPRSVLTHVRGAEAYSIAELGRRIVKLVGEPAPLTLTAADRELAGETEMAKLEPMTTDDLAATPAGFGCPSCHGSLFEMHGVPAPRYRCRVGHAWSSQTLLDEMSAAHEGALWMALRSLEEKAALSQRLARRATERGNSHTAARYAAAVDESEHAAEQLRDLIGKLGTMSSADRELSDGA
jgi:two-component system chemotaxis response regulator CheB